MTVQPELPYGGDSHPNSGWSGSDTSRERAEEADASGATGARQLATLAVLERARARGATWVEVNDELNLGHGPISGVLSNLHNVGLIARLVGKRNRCKVYVLPEHVGGRLTEPYGRTSTKELMVDMYDVLRSYSPCMFHLAVDAERNPECRLCKITVLIKRYEAIYGGPNDG